MKNYQSQILEELRANGWELGQQVSEDLPWWMSEYWEIISHHERANLKILISFLVDPLYEGTHKSSAIYEIAAQRQFPDNRLDESNRIATLSMRKGHFDENLTAFLNDLQTFRRNES